MVPVRDTGVASLAPEHGSERQTAHTTAAELSKSLRQVIHLAPNCPVRQYLIYHSLLLTPLQKTEVRVERVLYWQHGGALGVSRAVASPCVA